MDIFRVLAAMWLLTVLCVLIYFGFTIPELGGFLLSCVAFIATVGAIVKVADG